MTALHTQYTHNTWDMHVGTDVQHAYPSHTHLAQGTHIW